MISQASIFCCTSPNVASKTPYTTQLAYCTSRDLLPERRPAWKVGFSTQLVGYAVPRLHGRYKMKGKRIRSELSETISDNSGYKGPQLDDSKISCKKENNILKVLESANSYIPHVVAASTVLALVFPPSFNWFTNRYFTPALGFLMFAVGVNSRAEDFFLAIKRPGVLTLGYIGQFVIKPLLGYAFGNIAIRFLQLPEAIGSGLILTSCVSGAQLSNYATYLTDPDMAPLSIVMTALSTATAVVVTPLLTLVLLGKRLPVDVKGMMSSIMQIVVVPIAAGLLLNKFAPKVCSFIRQFLPLMSVIVTALCVGAPLAININAIRSGFGLAIVLPVVAFHSVAFLLGYILAGAAFPSTPDRSSLQRTISFETGMQSSLLGLALANKFFKDPLVGVPSAISVVVMSLMGFALVVIWRRKISEA